MIRIGACYAAGVLFADLVHVPSFALLIGSFVLALLALLFWRTRRYLLGPLLFCFAAANLALHTAVLSPHDLRRLLAERDEDVAIQGTLCQTPSAKFQERAGEISWRTVAEMDATSLRLNAPGARWEPAFGRVVISTPGILPPSFHAGQAVSILGRLRPPKAVQAQGLFDYRNYLRRQGIYYQLQAVSPGAWRLQATNHLGPPPLTDRFVAWGKSALARGLPAEDESLRLEWALTLGWKPALTEEVSEPFIRAATYHIFAVDGLRIAIVGGIFLGLFQLLGMPRAPRGLLIIPVIWFYTGMTGYPASAIRAAVMATIVIAGYALRRPSDLVNSLFAAAFIILLWRSQQLFQAGFQLSFLVVLCIILLVPPMQQFGRSLFRSDPLLPEELRPRWRKVVGRPGHYVWEIFLVSLAAWLGSIPLVAYYFHILTPVSVPANLAAVPLCGLVLVCNLISLSLASWFPLGSEIYNQAGWFLMECIRVSSQWFERWPAAWFNVSEPSLCGTGLYYLLLLTIVTGWVFRLAHRRWVLGSMSLLTCGWCLLWALEFQTARLTVLPLKGGAAILAQGPRRADNCLIDSGNETSVRSVIKPFLAAQGLNALPHMVLTHGDVNHVGGAGMLRQQFPVKEVDVSPVPFRSPVYRRLITEFAAVPGLLKTLQPGDRIGRWQVLHPGAEDRFPLADDNALVLLGTIHRTRVLLLSDLGKSGQNGLVAREPDLRAEIVVACLPQQSEPLAEALLEAIQPRLIIISDSEYPASARANRKLRERLAAHRIPVIYTSESGAATLCFRSSRWRVETMNRPAELAPSANEKISEDESTSPPRSVPEE